MIEVWQNRRGDFLDPEEKCEALENGAMLCDNCDGIIEKGDTFYRVRTCECWCWKCINDVAETHW